MACRYLGIDEEVTVDYPREFHILDVPEELKTLVAVKELGYRLPTYEAAKLKRIISNDIGGIGEETMERIEAEIEDGLKGETKAGYYPAATFFPVVWCIRVSAAFCRFCAS